MSLFVRLVLASLLFVSGANFARAQNPTIQDLLLPNEPWKLVGEGYKFTEGPTPDKDGNLFFVDVPDSKIFKVDLTGKISVFAENTGNASGLAIGPHNRLYACQSGGRKIVWYDEQGKMTVLCDDVGPNDICVDAVGGVYMTDMGGRKVLYIDPQGQKKVVAEGFQPNGLTLTPDFGTLVVADWEKPVLQTFRVGKDGTLEFREGYYSPLQMPADQDKPGSDGMTVDDAGQLYVATHAGLQVFDPTGRLIGTIAKPQPKFLSNVRFGGPQFDTLYVTCMDKVYSRKVKAKGTPGFLRPAAAGR